MISRDNRYAPPPVGGRSGDQGIGALFLLLVLLAVGVGLAVFVATVMLTTGV